MKKTLHLLSALVCVLLAAFLCVLTACSGCNDTPDPDPGPGPDPDPVPTVTETLQSVSVDASGAKISYYVGESFTAAGIVVTASVQKSDATSPETRTVTDEAVVDSSAFDNTTAGTYAIVVSYTLANQTKSDSYDVVVIEYMDGADVTLKADYDSEYTLSDENPTVDLSQYADMIEVRRPDHILGVVDPDSAPIAATEYTVALYRYGAEDPVADPSAVGSGVYQIWVTLNDKVGDFTLEGFTLIYVYNSDGSLDTDEEAPELPGGGIQFDVATIGSGDYASGKILAQTADVTLSISESTNSYVVDASSKAIYANGVASSTKMENRLKFTSAISGTEGNVKDALKLTVSGACTVTFYVRSSSSSADRTVALYSVEADGTLLEHASDEVVTNNYAHAVEFTITEAGTYYLGATDGGIGVYGVDVTLAD